MRTDFLLKSDVLTAVAVEAVARGGKNTSGHRTRPFRSRCLKSLTVIPGNRGFHWNFTGVHGSNGAFIQGWQLLHYRIC